MEKERKIARDILKRELEALTAVERRVIEKLANRQVISRVTDTFEDRTFGQVVADRVASFGGSWTFIGLFVALMVAWVALNSYILVTRAFDPYPYILLNLFLSMMAALQAPVIMMSQNRQSAKDREAAEHDYEVNLKAELEIAGLHQKLDELRERQWVELISFQQRQIELLEELLKDEKAT